MVGKIYINNLVTIYYQIKIFYKSLILKLKYLAGTNKIKQTFRCFEK